MNTQTQTSSESWSVRNQQDDVHNRQQQLLVGMAARAEKASFKDEISAAKVDVVLPLDLQVHRSIAESKVLDAQLIVSQMLMASALYWPQFAMSAARQDLAPSVRPPPRVENALASYRAISSVTKTGASLAATA
ncbi:MAG: hypothetical protein NT086_00600 [Proteobacteria bacterium]|nr:hypothetical protein [Pseudomonadota bacterium]